LRRADFGLGGNSDAVLVADAVTGNFGCQRGEGKKGHKDGEVVKRKSGDSSAQNLGNQAMPSISITRNLQRATSMPR